MKPNVISLDLSTKSGIAWFSNGELKWYGLVKAPKRVYSKKYPWSYVERAEDTVSAIFNCINRLVGWHPHEFVLVVEETNIGKSRYAQKLIEFIHHQFLITARINELDVCYVNTSEWRRIANVRLTDEDKKSNRVLRDAVKKGKSKKAIGIKGKTTLKHVSVRTANSLYKLALTIKDNDVADAICLGHAFINGAKLAGPSWEDTE
jgi:hypothetical protein